MIFSATKLEAFLRCPGMYKHKYILKEPETSGEPAEVGKMVHAMIHGELTKTPMLKAVGPSFMEANRLFEVWKKRFADELDGNDVLSVEEEFSIPLGGHTLHGFMDDVRDIGGFLTVTDWKTGFRLLTAEEMRNNIQVRCYCIAGLVKYPTYKEMVFRIGAVRQATYQHIEVEKEEVETWAQDVIALMKMVEAHTKAIEDKSAFPYVPCASCAFCGMFDSCEAGKKAVGPSKPPLTMPSASKLAGNIELLERHLKEAKDQLKIFVEAKGPVAVGEARQRIVWNFWPKIKTFIDNEILKDAIPKEEYEAYLRINDGAKSGLWKDEILLAKLKEKGCVKEKTSIGFGKKKVESDETPQTTEEE